MPRTETFRSSRTHRQSASTASANSPTRPVRASRVIPATLAEHQAHRPGRATGTRQRQAGEQRKTEQMDGAGAVTGSAPVALPIDDGGERVVPLQVLEPAGQF